MKAAAVNMVKQQIAAWGVTDQALLDLFLTVPRDQFVREEDRDLAYADMKLPILNTEVMLSPKEEAKILAALKLEAYETVLEVGTGSGYFAALLAHLTNQVFTVELNQEIATLAAGRLASYKNIMCETGNAANGFAAVPPVDVIVITGALPFLPVGFKANLKPKGRILAILGESDPMQVCLVERNGEDWHSTVVFETQVPLLHRAPEPERFVF